MCGKRINLSSRLLKCCEMVSAGAKIADIGTDHAYVPIYLLLNNKITCAVASDLNSGPLETAQKNINFYNLQDKISVRCSDGLKNIGENEVEEIIIAGMGGNLIIKILEECSWENKKNKKFILQPMKYEKNLRKYLASKGYGIISEHAVQSLGKIYVVLTVKYTGVPYVLNSAELYIGSLGTQPDSQAKMYIKKQIKNLHNHLQGAVAVGNKEEQTYYKNLIDELENLRKNN